MCANTPVEMERMARKRTGGGREGGSAEARSLEAKRCGIAGTLACEIHVVVSIIVNFPSEVIARKRPWRVESHFSQERARARGCAI